MIKKRNFWLWLLFTIITIGIYDLFYMWRYGKDINEALTVNEKPSMNYIAIVFISIISLCIPLYVWTYRIGKKSRIVADENEIKSNADGWFFLLFSFIINPVINRYVMISLMNKLALKQAENK